MTDQPDYAAIAKEDFDRSRDFWKGRAAYFKAGVQVVMGELGISQTEALTVFAALLNDNAANLYRLSIQEWRTVMDRHTPVAQEMLDMVKEQVREVRPPWEEPR